ncbi:MAG: hypothetical protein JNM17_19525 [Archangium sp.]|nr:hypothetical protein [Archangium sp.]
MRYVRWVVAVILVLSFGFCGSKACVSFIQFGARSKEAEPRAALRLLASRERAFFADAGRWATTFEELDFDNERSRWRYALAPDESRAQPGADGGAHVVLSDDAMFTPHAKDEEHRAALPTDAWTPLDAGAFVIFASGNIDADFALSVWRVSSLDLPCADQHGPDEPCRVVDDLE